MSSGGKRKGAGRPARTVPLVAITLRVEPGVFRAWQKKKGRMSGPKLLEKLLTTTPRQNP